MILAWTGDELLRGQTWWRTDWRTDGRTDAGNDNTRRPILVAGIKTEMKGDGYEYNVLECHVVSIYAVIHHRYLNLACVNCPYQQAATWSLLGNYIHSIIACFKYATSIKKKLPRLIIAAMLNRISYNPATAVPFEDFMIHWQRKLYILWPQQSPHGWKHFVSAKIDDDLNHDGLQDDI